MADLASYEHHTTSEVAPERPLRVASVCRNVVIGGDENRLLHTVLAYDRDRVEPVVFVVDATAALSAGERRRWSTMLDRYRQAGIEVVEIGRSVELGSPRGMVDVAGVVRRLAAELRRRDIDVVDARSGLPAVLGLAAARLARTPVVTLTTYYTSWFETPTRRIVGQAAIASIGALISDAQATLDDFDRWRWSDRAELALIPNGIPPATSGLDRAAARAALGLSTDLGRPVVGQISRVLPRKGYETFLRAARLVLDVEPDALFVGVGFVGADQRPYFEGLLDLHAELGLGDSAVLAPYPGPIGDAYAALDVFAHLSSADSSPIAIHESMSVGLPAVVSALPGNVEIVLDGTTGRVVPVDDPRATADAMLDLLRRPEEAARLGTAAQERYRRRHLPEAMAAAHEALFRRLLADRR